MADKKILLKISVTALVSGMAVFGCATSQELKEVHQDIIKKTSEVNKDINKNTGDVHKDITKKAGDVHEENKNSFGAVNDNLDEVNKKLDQLLDPSRLETYPENARIVPVSMEIIERTKAEKIDIGKLDFYLSANITVYINETDDRLELQNGKLVERKINQSEEIPITIGRTGRMASSGNNFFGISFTEENVVLRFERNTVRNRFDLVSASKRGKSYALNFENERPYLVINYPYIPNEKNIHVQAVGASVPARNDIPSRVENDIPPRVNNDIPPRVDIGNSAEKINGRGTLTQAAVVQFLFERNRNYPRSFLEDFIGAYFREAGNLDINPDIAIAQMCHITNFLKNEKVMNTHNYAGFVTMPAGGRFHSKEEGILAHIQHLKGYADDKYKPSFIVDPRWENITSFRGTIDNLDELAKIWSPNNRAYTAEISKIINDMRRYAQGKGV